MTTKEKHYLISYSYKDSRFEVQNAMYLTKKNPFDWILETVKKDYARKERHFENYVLLNFWEITKKQYEEMDGTIG
jgi:hypothetical protein